jgi:hypothetical protein
VQQIVELQIRDDLVVRVQNQFQLVLHTLRDQEVHCSIEPWAFRVPGHR